MLIDSENLQLGLAALSVDEEGFDYERGIEPRDFDYELRRKLPPVDTSVAELDEFKREWRESLEGLGPALDFLGSTSSDVRVKLNTLHRLELQLWTEFAYGFVGQELKLQAPAPYCSACKYNGRLSRVKAVNITRHDSVSVQESINYWLFEVIYQVFKKRGQGFLKHEPRVGYETYAFHRLVTGKPWKEIPGHPLVYLDQ